MFKRSEFDRCLIMAQSHLGQAESNPAKLHNALIMMMNAMKVLADSCENDFQDQMMELATECDSGMDR